MPGIVQPVSIVQIVRSLSDSGDSPAPLLKIGKNIYHFGVGDLGSDINNDGSFGFNPTGGPATFRSSFINITNKTLSAVSFEFAGTETGMAPALGVAINDGTWVSDTTDISIPDGTTQAPVFAYSNKLVLSNQMEPNDNYTLSLVLGSGWWAGTRTFGTGGWPESNLFGSYAFDEGDLLTDTVMPGIGIGPLMTKVIGHYSGDPLVWWSMFGDSTVAMVRPVASSNSNAREGVWFFANNIAQTSGHNVRITTYGQGGATWDNIKTRIRSSLGQIKTYTNVVGVQLWSWNESPQSIAEANTQWDEWLVIKAEIEAEGLDAVPFILLPPTTRNSVGQLQAYDRLHELVTAAGGLTFDDLVSSGRDIIGAYSEDNVHLNRDGGFAQAPGVESRIYDKTLALGFSI